MPTIRVVLAGAGGFGETWWPTLSAWPDRLTVAGVVDPDVAARDRAAARFSVPTVQTAPALTSAFLRKVHGTLLIDSAPPAQRLPHAELGAAAGLTLLVAKPLGRSFAEAEQIMHATQHATSLAVAQQMRYFPCFLALRELLASQSLGPLVAVRVTMALDGRGWVPGTHWRLRMDHPLLVEAAIHHFDLLRWCLGTEMHVVSAHEWNPPWSPFRTGASAVVLLRTASGTPVRYEATFAPRRGQPAIRFDSGWNISCKNGRLVVTDGALYVNGQLAGPAATAEPVPLETLNQTLFGVWLNARDTGNAAPFDGMDNLHSMALLDQAISAAERAGGHADTSSAEHSKTAVV
jgi:predicted dehydrogenase